MQFLLHFYTKTLLENLLSVTKTEITPLFYTKKNTQTQQTLQMLQKCIKSKEFYNKTLCY